MDQQSLAVTVTAPGKLQIEEVNLADLGPRDVLIRTLFSGVSTGTDKWVMQGIFTWMDLSFPLVPGYQRSGIVEAIGSQVSEFSIGQEVVATTSSGIVEASPAWGGHCSLAISPCDEVYDATGIDAKRASLFISAQVGFNAASRLPNDRGERIVVFGDGIIGVSGALAARARGFDVLLVGRHGARMHPLADFSINTVDSRSCTDAVRSWQPVAVIDTVQNDEAFANYVDALPTESGVIIFSGHSPDGVKNWASMELMQKRELTASFVSGWTPSRIRSTLQLMREGHLALEQLATVSSSTRESIERLMDSVLSGSLPTVAGVIDWRSLS